MTEFVLYLVTSGTDAAPSTSTCAALKSLSAKIIDTS